MTSLDQIWYLIRTSYMMLVVIILVIVYDPPAGLIIGPVELADRGHRRSAARGQILDLLA